MPDREIWSAALDVADVLGQRAAVREFRQGLKGGPVATAINGITSMYSMLKQDTSIIGMRLEYMRPERDAVAEVRGGAQWLAAADAVAGYTVLIAEHIRSRLPGYPILRVPHVIDGSPHVIDNPYLFDGFPWLPELRKQGLQLAPAPPSNSLGAGPPAERAVAALCHALAETDTWQQFARIASSLTADDRAQLTAVRRRFTESVSEGAMAEQAGLFGAHGYQRAMLAETVGSATGRVHEYLLAFAAINETIDMVLALIGTAVSEKELVTLTPYRMDTGAPGPSRDVELAIRGASFDRTPGQLLLVDHPEPALSGLVFPTTMTHMIDGGRTIISGKLLAGTSGLLERAGS
jgi:hypothetical protein